MLLCISGPKACGKNIILSYLKQINYDIHQFTPLACEKIMDQKLWNEKIAIKLPSISDWNYFKKRPFAKLLIVYAPPQSEWRNQNDDVFFQEFITMKNNKCIVDFYEVLNYKTIDHLLKEIGKHTFSIRPSFDPYFIMIAFAVSQRSNCMKTKVGAIIVKDTRIIATGYNGTPTGILNCYEGGCIRCNSNIKNNQQLTYCVCLHAEESALLNIGYERCRGSYIYCTHFPCQLCFRKIVQMGIKKVFYRLNYSQNDDYIIKCFKESDIQIIHLP